MENDYNAASEPGEASARPENLTKEFLTDESLAALDVAAVERIRRAVEACDDELPFAIRLTATVLEADPKNRPARLAQGLLQERLDDPSLAGPTLLVLARELAKAECWEPARWVARRGIARKPDHRFVELLLKVGAALPDGLNADLAVARVHCPSTPELAWHDSDVAEAEGDFERAGLLAVEALRGFAELDAVDRAESAVLRALESSSESVLREFVRDLPAVARAKHGLELIELAMELSDGCFNGPAFVGDYAAALKEILLRNDGRPASVRVLYVKALTASLGGESAVGGLVRTAGLGDGSVPFADAVARYDSLAAYLPGAHVFDRDWGVGRVVAHDGAYLTVAFREKPGHRMSLQIAFHAISVIPDTLVSVAYFEDPEEIVREREEEPASLVVRAVIERGGEVGLRDLKEILTREIVAPDEWPAWWRRARDAAKADTRLDATQSFRDVFRLAAEGARNEAATAAPKLAPLDTKKGLKSAAIVVGKLLKQHPELEAEAAERYAIPLSLGLETERSVSARLSVLPYMAAWLPDRRQEWVAETCRAIADGGQVTDHPDLDGQTACLGLALEGDCWQQAALGGTLSKYPDMQARSWQALLERSGAELRRELERMLSNSMAPAATVQLVSSLLDRWDDLAPPQRPEPWLALLAVLPTLAKGGPPKAAESARRLLTGAAGLESILREAVPPSDGTRERLALIVRRVLSGADGALVCELLDRAGHQDVAEALRAPEEVVEAVGEMLPERDPDVVLMTRKTRALLEQRLADLQERLRAVLEDLERARAHGDVSDNAEYDTAREQRAMLLSTMESTTNDLAKARFIEELDIDGTFARPGTEVTFAEDGAEEPRVVWLLGEGDSALDENVVSYKAPLGQSLLGARPGSRVVFELHGQSSQLEILKVTRKLPEP